MSDSSGTDDKRDTINPSKARWLHKAPDSGSLPQGAVRLTDRQVAELLTQHINTWKPENQMWPLKYGTALLAAMASINGAVFTAHFRQRMMLGAQARTSSYIPAVVVPFYSALLLHQHLAYKRLLAQKDCVACENISAVSVQLVTGAVQPYLMAIFASAAVAKVTSTYPLPPIQDFVGFFRTIKVLSHGLRRSAIIVAASTVINTILLVEAERKAIVRLHSKVTETTTYVP